MLLLIKYSIVQHTDTTAYCVHTYYSKQYVVVVANIMKYCLLSLLFPLFKRPATTTTSLVTAYKNEELHTLNGNLMAFDSAAI